MEEIVTSAKLYGLEPMFFEKSNEALKYVSKTLSITIEEAMLISFFLEQSSRGRIRISSIAEMINVSNIRMISMINVADNLVKKGLLIGRENAKDEKYYIVPPSVVSCIRQGLTVTPVKISGLTDDEFFDHLADIFNEEDVSQWERISMIENLVCSNPDLHYCKKLQFYDIHGVEYLLLNIFVHRLINEDDDNIGPCDWEDMLVSKSFVRKILKSLKNGTSPLIQKGIMESKGNDGVRDPHYYHLTPKAKEELFPDMELADSDEAASRSLIAHNTFAPKHLYYAQHIQSQIDRLAELLKPERFRSVTARLEENGMRKGFACLFYGSPGTGKTETVNQIARMTGRDVLLVDVSQIKSCWVGESEQNIKALFTSYRKLVKNRSVAPILLFNEADAILGNRYEGAERAVDKMENSIQNIILQEMETMEGIMIATTNLTSNLDDAFERRFLYKIKFERPTVEAKQFIWKSMIPTLSDTFAYTLAKEYDLSGGQIENIARKRTVELILSGVEPSEELIHEYCKAEIINTKKDKHPKVGFTRY